MGSFLFKVDGGDDHENEKLEGVGGGGFWVGQARQGWVGFQERFFSYEIFSAQTLYMSLCRGIRAVKLCVFIFIF